MAKLARQNSHTDHDGSEDLTVEIFQVVRKHRPDHQNEKELSDDARIEVVSKEAVEKEKPSGKGEKVEPRDPPLGRLI